MFLTGRWTTVGRGLLTASALVIFASVPDLLATSSTGRRTALLAGSAVVGALWTWFWWWAIDSPRPAAAPLAVVLLTAVLAFLTYLAPPGRDGLLLAALAAGAAFEPRRSAPAVAGIVVLAGAVQIAHGGGPATALGGAVNNLVVGVAGIGGRLLLVTNRELARARDEIARLAVSEERLRFARDLHDLLGQDLTLAVLKSELAAQSLPEAAPARALLSEVAALVRQALDDVRAAVTGYRQLDLETELASARAALAAAGIDLSVERGLEAVPAAQENALAWALRETVTNVLRHSAASHCAVRLRHDQRSAVLVVEDDGRGGDGPEGSGLRGLAERVAAAGGSFDASALAGRGFRVRVAIPLPP